MTSDITKSHALQCEGETAPQLFDDWFDPIETAVRERAREFIEELIRSELDAALARPRYEHSRKAGREGTPGMTGHRHGSRSRSLIGSCYLAGTNTRRVRRALSALFAGAVGKDTVSRVWRKVKSDWDAWNARSLAEEPIVRLILDGTVVRVRLDRRATAISLLVVIGVRADGQKVLLAIKSMGGESTEAWRTVLDDLITRGLRRPEFLIVD